MRSYGLQVLALLLFAGCRAFVEAQPDRYRMTKEDYIARYRDDAVKDMLKTGVPASITLAQGILESEFGNSYLARKANNHFGIKCHSEWNGKKVYKDDDERKECFRKYATVIESFDDHSDFLRSRDRYASLFDLRITDYKGWARGLKKAGYATNPRYADQLIRIIEDHDLNRLDEAGSRMPVTAGDRMPAQESKMRKSRARPAPLPASRLSDNNVPYVVAADGDSYYSLALAHRIELWQVLKYNDAEKDETPAAGDVIYLKPKRNKASASAHVVADGESMRDISQQHAVKLRKLYKYNHMACGQEPEPGQVIRLR